MHWHILDHAVILGLLRHSTSANMVACIVRVMVPGESRSPSLLVIRHNLHTFQPRNA